MKESLGLKKDNKSKAEEFLKIAKKSGKAKATSSTKDLSVSVKPKRSVTIDILRTIAVVLMILTHVTALVFNFEGGEILQLLSLAGGTLCFTFFLLLSGVGLYFSYVKKTDPEEITFKRHGLFIRSVEILIVYYIVASFSMFVLEQGFFGSPSSEWIRDFLRIAAFQRFPDFTEFLITLSIVMFISIFLKGFFDWISKSLVSTTVISVVAYLMGFFLYEVEFEYEPLNYVKGVFAGFSDLHLFPLLQYFGIFIFGIYIGRKILSKAADRKKYLDLGFVGLMCVIFYGISSYFTFYESSTSSVLIDASVYSGRFPPSAPFLALGLGTFIFGLIAFEFLFRRSNLITNPIRNASLFISKNALDFFVLHIVLLLGAKLIAENFFDFDFSTGSSLLIYLLTILIVIVSSLLIMLKHATIDVFFRVSPMNFDVSLFKFVMIIFFLVAVFFGINREVVTINANKISVGAEVLEKQVVTDIDNVWFDDEYVGRAEISVEDDDIVNKDNWVYIDIDHVDYLSAENSFYEDGRDLRIVRLKNDNFTDVPVVIKEPNTIRTRILFKVENDPDDQYFLYFGNEFAPEVKKSSSESNLEFAEEVRLIDIEVRPLRIDLEKNWYLRGFRNSTQYETMNFEFLDTSAERLLINFVVLDVNESIVKSGVLNANDVLSGRISMDTSDLTVGQYFLQLSSIRFDDSLEILNSKKHRFFTSYPLFVNWSIDWEGFGVNQSDLDVIVNISDTYNIPITHYFNPVIFIPGVMDPGLANYYKNWVMNRAAVAGDEIGLHNHLTPQLLSEVGVDANPEAQIVGIGRDETALNGYDKEELTELIDWSVNKFIEVGLGIPKSYRAGAWMVNPELLQVLDEFGFNYDSSGRTGGYLTRSAGSTPIPWNLQATTKPYRPNVNDINSAASPRLTLWEFPNNGADSFWFSLEELIDRFNVNFETTMASPQVVTYLSHPHGFEYYDSAKIRGLLDHVKQYRFDLDKGPVIQTTLEDVYNDYNLSTF
jgi:uncharacterized membrane protein